jgi:hypothetical protein
VTDDAMRTIRQREQEKAAVVGEYAAVVMLDRTSADVQGPGHVALVQELTDLLRAARPEVVYTHSPRTGIRRTYRWSSPPWPPAARCPPASAPRESSAARCGATSSGSPQRTRSRSDVSGRDSMGAALMGVFESQIVGGKRYDLAVPARRLAHADVHTTRTPSMRAGGPLPRHGPDPARAGAGRSVAAYVQECIDRFRGRTFALASSGSRAEVSGLLADRVAVVVGERPA